MTTAIRHPLSSVSSTRITSPRTYPPFGILDSENAADQAAPNGVDLRVDRVFEIAKDNYVVLSEKQKVHANKKEMYPTTVVGPPLSNKKEAAWVLNPGSYEVIFEEQIHVGIDEAGWLFTRSTLNRNGIFLTTGLYDSGYDGKFAAVLHVTGPGLMLVPGTRIAQYVSLSAQSLKNYAESGSYGHGSDHDSKVYADGTKVN